MVYGGRGCYGSAIGILMLDSKMPRIPGDIGNATTFRFPVMYKIIEGASSQRVIDKADDSLIEPFVKGARELAAAGCKAICTSCGFLAMFQRELAAAVEVPVFTSSLIQAGMVYSMLTPEQKVGVLTAKKEFLGARHFDSVGIGHVPLVVEGIDNSCFIKAFDAGADCYDERLFEEEMAEASRRLVKRDGEIGAVVLECTNMPPFAHIVQRETGLAVFDIVTLVNYVYEAVVKRRYEGHM